MSNSVAAMETVQVVGAKGEGREWKKMVLLCDQVHSAAPSWLWDTAISVSQQW